MYWVYCTGCTIITSSYKSYVKKANIVWCVLFITIARLRAKCTVKCKMSRGKTPLRLLALPSPSTSSKRKGRCDHIRRHSRKEQKENVKFFQSGGDTLENWISFHKLWVAKPSNWSSWLTLKFALWIVWSIISFSLIFVRFSLLFVVTMKDSNSSCQRKETDGRKRSLAGGEEQATQVFQVPGSITGGHRVRRRPQGLWAQFLPTLFWTSEGRRQKKNLA